MRLVIDFAIQKRSCVVSRRTNRSCDVSRRTVCMYKFILNYISVAFRMFDSLQLVITTIRFYFLYSLATPLLSSHTGFQIFLRYRHFREYFLRATPALEKKAKYRCGREKNQLQ